MSLYFLSLRKLHQLSLHSLVPNSKKENNCQIATLQNLFVTWKQPYSKVCCKTTAIRYMSRLMTKPTKWSVRPAKTQISLGICPVWSESSLSTWRKLGSLATHWAHSEDSDQADLSLRWAHRSFCWFCHKAAQFWLCHSLENISLFILLLWIMGNIMRITRRCTLISLSAIVSQNRLNPITMIMIMIMQRAKIDRSVRSAAWTRQCYFCKSERSVKQYKRFTDMILIRTNDDNH